MAPSFQASAALFLLLLLFFGVNIHNVVTGARTRRGSGSHAEVPSPRDAYTSLASLGTILFFVFSIVYVAAGLTGSVDPLGFATPSLPSHSVASLSALGLTSISAGVFLFLWSVVARGRYSVSWEMPRDHRLVTWGPYRHIRHPSYTGYFLMFIGLPLLTQSPVYTLPLMAIPGYLHVVEAEELLLAARFGEEYVRYAASTGRFTPRIRRSR